MRIRSLCLIMSFTVLLSCKSDEEKKKYTSLKVHVVNPVGNVPISDLLCSVIEDGDISAAGLLNQGYSTNGVYEFNFLASKNKSYTLICSPDLEKYFPASISQYSTIVKYQPNEFNFRLVPQAHIRYHYKNVSCFDDNDKLVINRWNLNVPELDDLYPLPLMGCLDNFTSYNWMPVGMYHYHWEVTKNGITNSFDDTISLSEGDSLTYHIEY